MAKVVAPDVEELKRLVRSRNLRATPSRLGVLALLRTSESPISHGDAADALAAEGWDRATIYRNLMDLSEAGLARRTDVGDHVWRFELISADHATAPSHPHFVCTECGTVECMPDADLTIRRARAPRAVKARQVEVHVRGLCDACG